MRRLSLRLAIALITFIIGIAAASVWLVSRHSSPTPASTGLRQALANQPEPDPVTQDRDLSLYDYGGLKGCRSLLISDVPRCQAARTEARDFIWKHWQERRRGYIIFQFTFDDGGSDGHIFIEPDENGAWRIAWRERVFAVGFDGKIKDVPDIRSIEQRPAKQYDTERMYDVGPVGTLILILRDADGKEVGIF